jgi:SAM-dependent methyltransferase
MVLGGQLGYRLLRWISPPEEMKQRPASDEFECGSKLAAYWGTGIWQQIIGKTVIDFGCGEGKEAIEVAKHGAKLVIGVDIRQRALDVARKSAETAGVARICRFAETTTEKADVVLSTDAFEHFADPAAILHVMAELLKPDGRVLATFGPPWFHPKGGHSFSVFPWAHLVFSERALIRWRSDFKTDGATRFCEIDGGLNQMTVRAFKRLVERSEFEVESLETIPIRALRWLHNPVTREFVTSVVRCRLRKKPAPVIS